MKHSAKRTKNYTKAKQERYELFFDWLRQHGAVFRKMALSELSQDNRIVFSTKRITKGEVILFLPKTLLLSQEVAERSPWIQNLKSNLPLLKTFRSVPSMTELSFFLALERANPNTFWKPYFDVLPETFEHFPLHFSDKDIAFAAGSVPLSDNPSRIRRRLNTFLAQLHEQFPEMRNVTDNDYLWALSICSSRAFNLIINGKGLPTLAPLIDFFNHSAQRNNRWQYNSTAQGLQIHALVDQIKNANLTVCYGKMKHAPRFLAGYGFIPKDAHPCLMDLFWACDEILASSTEGEHDGAHDTFLSLVPRINLTESYDDHFRKMMDYLRQIHCPKTQTPPTEASHQPDPVALEQAALTILARVVKHRLARYGRSEDENQELLRAKSLTQNESNILRVIIGEQRILGALLACATTCHTLLLTATTQNHQDLKPKALALKQYEGYLTEVIHPLVKHNDGESV